MSFFFCLVEYNELRFPYRLYLAIFSYFLAISSIYILWSAKKRFEYIVRHPARWDVNSEEGAFFFFFLGWKYTFYL